MAGPLANRAGLVLAVTAKDRAWPPSSGGPAEMAVAQPLTDCGPAFVTMDWSAPLVKDGASLTGLTEIVNVCAALVSLPPLAAPPLSLSTTVTTAVPTALAVGV